MNGNSGEYSEGTVGDGDRNGDGDGDDGGEEVDRMDGHHRTLTANAVSEDTFWHPSSKNPSVRFVSILPLSHTTFSGFAPSSCETTTTCTAV